LELRIKINREIPEGTFKFKQVFSGFEDVEIVKNIFGEKTETVLDNLYVIVEESRGYLYVDDSLGAVVVNKDYLKNGKDIYLYLDVIHELVHIKQFMEGKELFDTRYSYVERPTEIEAYRITVEEAKRIGLSDKQIADYLRVEWISEEEWRKLMKNSGLIQ
jgi:hypothetical protein